MAKYSHWKDEELLFLQRYDTNKIIPCTNSMNKDPNMQKRGLLNQQASLTAERQGFTVTGMRNLSY